jgi:glycosyltransferase involved in cell wall biosynthesis
MKRIVWLCTWYPNKSDVLLGDFIERHAIAASTCNKISVLHVFRDIHEKPGKISRENRLYNSNAGAEIIGYNCVSIPVVGRIISIYRYARIHLRWIRKYILENGKPDLVHIHVATRVAFLALYIKWKYKIPFVISEQSTIFLADAKPNFNEFDIFTKRMCTTAMKKTLAVSTVSEHLGKSLKELFGIEQYTVIPNVVNTDLFYPAEKNNALFTFIHVSTLHYQKNPDQIVEAIYLLSRKCRDFQLIVYGPDNKHLHDLIRKYNLEAYVGFRQEVPQYELAIAMRTADALILYSRYETFGCVIIEALASGLPVVVSDIPVLHELVDEQNGIVVELNNPELLAEKLFRMIQNKNHYDAHLLAEATRHKYSFNRVGKMFDEWYENILRS